MGTGLYGAITVTGAYSLLYVAVSVGINTAVCGDVDPSTREIEETAHANVPDTLAEPPDKVTSDNRIPYPNAEGATELGHAVTIGLALYDSVVFAVVNVCTRPQ